MRKLYSLGLGVALAVGLVGSAAAAGAGATADSAIPLTANAAVDPDVPGSSGGGFSYYTLDGAAASGDVLNIAIPTAFGATNELGANIWEGSQLLATTSGMNLSQGLAQLPIVAAAPGPVLVQLYNYAGITEPVALELVNPTSGATVAPLTPPTIPSGDPTDPGDGNDDD